METINNMAAAAAKAVWGDNDAKKEPVSGVNGDVSKGEPYDAGNLEPAQQEQKIGSSDIPSENPAKPEQKIGSSGTPPENPAKPEQKFGSPDIPSENPAKTSNPPSDNTSGQNDTRHPSDPATEHDPRGHNVDSSGEGPNSGVDFNTPGPKPIAEVAKEHGGDAGNLGKDGKEEDKVSNSSSSSLSSEEELPKGPTNERKKPDTEAYVQSSGLNADGGDFDASNPGAGREADRLLEEKGIHKPETPTKQSNGHAIDKSTSNGSASSGSTKEKVGLKDKIKAKLHVH